MTWNWQKSDWPKFRWEVARLALAEKEFLIAGGKLAGTIRHLGENEREQITVDSMSTEAVTTSEIEGECWIGQACNLPYAGSLAWWPTNGMCGPRSRALPK